MRVMVVTDQYEPMVGGVTAVTRGLARGLAGRGHTVAVVAPSPGRRGSRRADGSVSIILRGSVRWPWYEGMRLGCLPPAGAAALIASFAPDVAHIHSPVTLGVMTRIAACRQRVPVVYTNHFLPANVRAHRDRARTAARPRAPRTVWCRVQWGGPAQILTGTGR
jgi:glycosyltransferase involved in cell wall biosynthesis